MKMQVPDSGLIYTAANPFKQGQTIAVSLSGFRLLLLVLLLAVPHPVLTYPLDGTVYTGIVRLEGYRLAQEGKARARVQPSGALLPMERVQLRLIDREGQKIPDPDPAFSRQVAELLGEHRDKYGIAVLDLSNRDRPAYAEVRADWRFNPGSVGKMAVVASIFNALAKVYPQDIAMRERVLRETQVTADEFIVYDHHVVPFWIPEEKRIRHRRLQEGDRASLWTFLDWMMSASSNAAASMVMKELMKLYHFGASYPPTREESVAFFSETPRAELGRILRAALDEGVAATGLDSSDFRQGGFFTRQGKRRVPGGGSRATARGLLRYLYHLEQGRVVDGFSSLEIKRLMYMTQRRIRYASSPALNDAAVYFKSGSLYKCRPEADFKCGKYQGNDTNLLNSVAIVESPAGEPNGLFYLAVVTSNVLKENAAVAHQTLATRLHRLIEKRNLGIGSLED